MSGHGLLLPAEVAYETLDGADRLAGMEGGKYQMPGFGCGEGGLHRLQVPHLADHDDVRIFTHGGAHRLGIAGDVGMHLTVMHQAPPVGVDKLHRVFDRQDMAVAGAVDLVQQHRQGG